MTKSEWNELAAAVAESWKDRGAPQSANVVSPAETAEATVESAVRRVVETQNVKNRITAEDHLEQGAASMVRSIVETQSPAAGTPRSDATVESVARSVAAKQAEAQLRELDNVRPSAAVKQTHSSSAKEEGSSASSEALKIAAMVTGVGPIVTGLIKLFGGGSDEAKDVTAPVRFELPDAVRVNAGLTPDRSLAQISYAQGNQVRADGMRQSEGRSANPDAPALPAIQIQVNAMDSRSFMDHSDEIAQAVRTAMLRSHSLNDIISEV